MADSKPSRNKTFLKKGTQAVAKFESEAGLKLQNSARDSNHSASNYEPARSSGNSQSKGFFFFDWVISTTHLRILIVFLLQCESRTDHQPAINE